jgi:hypothetical protein
MDSPLDAFSSESSAGAPTRHATVPPRDARPGLRRTRRSSLINRIRRQLIDAVDWVADTIAAVAAFARTPHRWRVVGRWRRHSIRRPAWASSERLAVIATAALTSAAVSQFTLWIGSDRLPRAAEAPVADAPAVVARADAPVALELSGDRLSVGLGRVAAPVAPRRSSTAAETPAAALGTSPPLASRLVPAQDDSASQDAMLLQDRPVLMDARMPVGTTGSAPLRPAVVASLATERGGAGRAISSPARGDEHRGENSGVPRSADASAGLVVITQPEGARVTINGVGWGMTPLTVAHLPPGAKRVRITKPGYRSEERVVGTDPERPAATLRVALREVADAGRPH